MGKVYYNQRDNRWGSHPYPSKNHPSATVRTSGCGTTCAAMIISSCKEIIYPDKMSDISMENGYRALEGTSDGLFSYISERWGIEMKRLHSSYEAHQACKDGYFVVIACGKGLWTTGGHYILAVGANDNEIEIYDPYLYNGKFDINGRSGKVRLEGTSAWVQIDTFKANSNAQRFFAFKIGNDSIQEPVQEETTKIKYVNTKSANLNVRSSKGGSVVGSLPKGTQIVVYSEEDGWSKIGYNQWVSSSYLSDSKPQMSQPVNRGTVGKTKTFSSRTIVYENSNLSGTQYNYLAKTAVIVLENTSNSVDKIKVVKTGRVGYININAYGNSNSSVSAPSIPNTVGQTKKFKSATTIYSNSNLSGTRYQYKANTSVKILANISSTVDKISVIQTGRVGYVNKNSYK